MGKLPLVVIIVAGIQAPGAAGAADTAELEAQLETKLAERFERVVSLAQLYEASGEKDRAAHYYERARTIRPDDAYVLSQLARLYRSTRDDRKLLPIYTALARLQPTAINWVKELGSCYFRLGRRREAEATWRKMLEMHGNRPFVLGYLAQVYAEHELFDKAVAAYREAIDRSPRDINLRLRFASALLEAGDPLGALATAAPLREAPSKHYREGGENLRKKALAKLRLPQADQRAVLELLDDDTCSVAELALTLARAFERRGERERAAAFYRRVASEEPESPLGKAAAEKARQLDPDDEK
ncbi:MAG: tetratricopeptide repeat protein [Candidatus Brocadiia bacterium]